MKEDELIQFINTKVAPHNKRKVKASTLLFKEKILESINILYLIGYIEKRLGRKITDDEMIMGNFESVKTILKTFGES